MQDFKAHEYFSMDILMDIPTVFIQLTYNITYMSSILMDIWVALFMWFGHALFGDRHFEF